MMARTRLNDKLQFKLLYNDGFKILKVNEQLRLCIFNLVEFTRSFTLEPWASGLSDPNCFIYELPAEYTANTMAEGVVVSNASVLAILSIGLTDYTHIELRTLGKQLVGSDAIRGFLQWNY